MVKLFSVPPEVSDDVISINVEYSSQGIPSFRLVSRPHHGLMPVAPFSTSSDQSAISRPPPATVQIGLTFSSDYEAIKVRFR